MQNKKIYFTAMICSALFLMFFAGFIVGEYKVGPYRSFRDSVLAIVSMSQANIGKNIYQNNIFVEEKPSKTGLIKYDKENAFNGVTLFVSAATNSVYLISMQGQVLYKWNVKLADLLQRDPTLKKIKDKDLYARKALLYPNGDILMILCRVNDTPWGYGLVKLNKDSEVVWQYIENVHHDVEIAEDGNIYTLTHEFTNIKLFPKKKKYHILDDHVVVLSKEGEQLKKVSVTKAFLNSKYKRLLPYFNLQWDLWHTNNVEILGTAKAHKFSFLKRGQVLISMRNTHMIAVIDLDSEKIVWLARGDWLAQHDPDFLNNGNIMLFDNKGYFGSGGNSRIIEFDPQDKQFVWEYKGNESYIFDSSIRASQQKLPNGNVLISESQKGRLLEVTPAKKIVWEYISPFNIEGNIGVIDWAQRIPEGRLSFK